MLKRYAYQGLEWQYEEGSQPKGAVEIAPEDPRPAEEPTEQAEPEPTEEAATQIEPELVEKAAEPANKARKGAKNK